MRGFVDRGRDYLARGIFADDVKPHISDTLDLYGALRAHFQITEEDLDNIENVLSISELRKLVPLPNLPALTETSTASVQRFIEAVLVKAIRLPGPESGEWVGVHFGPPQKRLLAAIWRLGQPSAIITLNYDCILEYCSYCLGLPFTYEPNACGGVEILKLHGSINWMQCSNRGCEEADRVAVAPLEYRPTDKQDYGTVELNASSCKSCGAPQRPLIVPPTWAKDLQHPVLRATWARALEVLAKAEVLAVVGYSLPAADPQVRQLLHAGLSSANLRQALVSVGGDELAVERWKQFFRGSWRDYRLHVTNQTFDFVANSELLAVLGVSIADFGHDQLQLLPVPQSPGINCEVRERLSQMMKEKGICNAAGGEIGVNWRDEIQRRRNGTASDSSQYAPLIRELGLDWRPSGPLLPVHGSHFYCNE
ncbi:MAG: hypothetical protein LAQ69_49450 [Acidobacteriia bacterium]|nr:hypothetical protein [Terriglobia bacterium]